MEPVADLLDRPIYRLSELDSLLCLSKGTSRRWIDGYSRGAKFYPPVVREQSTGEEIVTWGEFVETRLLSEFRADGASMVNLRRSVEMLRERLNTRYPLAHESTLLQAEGRELVERVETEAEIPKGYRLVVIRNNQLALGQQAGTFVESVKYTEELTDDPVVEVVYPRRDLKEIALDPRRSSGEPTIAGRNIPIEVILEQLRAGDTFASILEAYELEMNQLESVVHYGLKRDNAEQQPPGAAAS